MIGQENNTVWTFAINAYNKYKAIRDNIISGQLPNAKTLAIFTGLERPYHPKEDRITTMLRLLHMGAPDKYPPLILSKDDITRIINHNPQLKEQHSRLFQLLGQDNLTAQNIQRIKGLITEQQYAARRAQILRPTAGMH